MFNIKTFIAGDVNKIQLQQNKLTHIASELGCTVEVWNNLDSVCAHAHFPEWKHETPFIRLSRNLAQADNLLGIMAFMHELGHIYDCRRYKDFPEYVKLLGIGEMEISAWEHAFRIAHKVGFTQFDDMKDWALQCMNTYFENGICKHRLDDHYQSVGARRHFSEAIERIERACEDSKRRIRLLAV